MYVSAFLVGIGRFAIFLSKSRVAKLYVSAFLAGIGM